MGVGRSGQPKGWCLIALPQAPRELYCREQCPQARRRTSLTRSRAKQNQVLGFHAIDGRDTSYCEKELLHHLVGQSGPSSLQVREIVAMADCTGLCSALCRIIGFSEYYATCAGPVSPT